MEYQRIIQLLVKYFNRQITDGEKPELEHWRHEGGHHQDWEKYHRLWELTGRYKAGYQPDVEKGWDRFQQRMHPPVPSTRRKWIAAGIIIAVLAALLFFFFWKQSAKEKTLPGPVAVATGSAQQRSVSLPDGSTVTLNENSRLSYTSDWATAPTREVSLQGEAFFQVAPRSDQPFVVHTSHTAVRVTGTAFNVRAYPEEQTTEVAVEEGQVSLRAHRINRELTLQAMDKGICEVSGKLFREKNAGQNARAWQTRKLWFRKTPLREVARSLHHYFGVNLEIQQPDLADCQINHPAFDRQEVSSTLEAIAYSLGARLEQTGANAYVFLNGNCRGNQ